MTVRALIPFKPVNPKSRLSGVMSQEEREAFARAMLDDVVAAVQGAGCTPVILSTAPFRCPGVETRVDGRGLNESLNGILPTYPGATLIIMSDLPLVVPEIITRMLTTSANISVVPGRGGGTNAIYLKNPARFRADYYAGSFLKHLKIAGEFGATVEVIDSFRLHTDVDEEADLAEVLIHGRGKSRAYLASLGFALDAECGRVKAERVRKTT
ncbi:MAG: 2-phospho-L-lactate guanylyltransferase [Methanomicrobiales archaeon]|nr:2-phospho-L-lactate guanylyltransferase [Methanomicrobiales archaeon]